jgi:phosphate transport system substrate-binding protein
MRKLTTGCQISIIALVALLLTALPLLSACRSETESETGLKGTITVSGAWALYPMMVKWAEEFQKIHPQVRIDVSAGGAGKGAADALGGLVDIGMVSREIYPAELEKGAFYVASVIDAVVPTASQNNPLKEEILTRGMKRQNFIDVWITGQVTDWKQIFPEANPSGMTDIHIYTRSDACGAAETWAKYLGKMQEDLLGIGVYGDPGLAEAVTKDQLGIGFNNIGYAFDAKSRKPVEGVLVIPIDINENGKIDPEENFYGTLDEITQAIAARDYPWPPARELNLLTLREFKGITKEFVRWILTDGQQYAPEAGYIALSQEKIQAELAKLR